MTNSTLLNSIQVVCRSLRPPPQKNRPIVLCVNKQHPLLSLTIIKIKNHRLSEYFAGCGRALERKDRARFSVHTSSGNSTGPWLPPPSSGKVARPTAGERREQLVKSRADGVSAQTFGAPSPPKHTFQAQFMPEITKRENHVSPH